MTRGVLCANQASRERAFNTDAEADPADEALTPPPALVRAARQLMNGGDV